jgi:hypothetical protein
MMRQVGCMREIPCPQCERACTNFQAIWHPVRNKPEVVFAPQPIEAATIFDVQVT